MKAKLLTMIGLIAAAHCMGQTTLWDGESNELGSKGGCWDDGSPSVVANPDKSGINNSEKCLKFTMTSSSKVVKIPFRDWIKPNLAGNRRVSLMIRKTTEANIQIELSDPTNEGASGYWEKTAAWYGNGGQWQKVVFDFSTNTALNDYPGVMTITAQTGDVSDDEDVYIDNVVIEPLPMVNGKALSSISDGSLSDTLKLTGAWMKGDCQNTDGDWKKVEYNDFSSLATKLSKDATSIDMRGTILKDAYNAFESVNPNLIVYADEAFDGDNVVANGKSKKLLLNENYSFAVPEEFTADEVDVTRNFTDGFNTVCLPFAFTAAEQGADVVAKYASHSTSDNTENVTFSKVEQAEANIPYILSGTKVSNNQVFSNKTIVTTPNSLTDGMLTGVYSVTDGEGKWGIGDQVFQKGAKGATFNAFHAFLTEPNAAKIALIISGTTGINAITGTANDKNDAVYNLNGERVSRNKMQKGIYIVNHKKVIVR